MANKRVTDLDAIATAPVTGVMHFVDTTDTTQNAAGSSFKVTKEDLLKENTAAILLNTNKISFDSTSSTRLANTSGTNTGDQDVSGLAPIENPTFTGTVAGITKTMVGLSNVPNTDFTTPINDNTAAIVTAVKVLAISPVQVTGAWFGTLVQYNALGSYSATVTYNIT